MVSIIWLYTTLILFTVLVVMSVYTYLKEKKHGYLQIKHKGLNVGFEKNGVETKNREEDTPINAEGKMDRLFKIRPDESKKVDLDRFEIMKTPDVLIKDPEKKMISSNIEMSATPGTLPEPQSNILNSFSTKSEVLPLETKSLDTPKTFNFQDTQEVKKEISPEDAFKLSLGYTKSEETPGTTPTESTDDTKEWQPLNFFRRMDEEEV